MERGNFVCITCGKHCKSKGGLKRHEKGKHKKKDEPVVTTSIAYQSIIEVIDKAIKTACQSTCFSREITTELTLYQLDICTHSELVREIQNLYKTLNKRGDRNILWKLLRNNCFKCITTFPILISEIINPFDFKNS